MHRMETRPDRSRMLQFVEFALLTSTAVRAHRGRSCSPSCRCPPPGPAPRMSLSQCRVDFLLLADELNWLDEILGTTAIVSHTHIEESDACIHIADSTFSESRVTDAQTGNGCNASGTKQSSPSHAAKPTSSI